MHPADWYIGVRRPNYFLDQKAGLETELVSDLAGRAGRSPACRSRVKLTQVQWNSVRRAEGNGFYTWETEKKLVPAGSWTVTSAATPVPLKAPLPSGGYFELEATAREASGRYAVTTTSFYALGSGYTAWERYDHNRIDLVADKPRYKPGDTARIMIQSPWERATALVTTEREGIRSHRQFTLTSTQQSVDDSGHGERHSQRLRLGAADQGPHRGRRGAGRWGRPAARTRSRIRAIPASRRSASATSS